MNFSFAACGLWKQINHVAESPILCRVLNFNSQSKSSVHDKLHELHSHFPPIAQRTPSIITSICWKSTVGDVTASVIDRKKGSVQNITCLVALTIRNLYDYKTKEYVGVLTYQSLSLWFEHQNLLYLFYNLYVGDIVNSYSCLINWANKSVTFWTRLFFLSNTGWPDVTNGTFWTSVL